MSLEPPNPRKTRTVDHPQREGKSQKKKPVSWFCPTVAKIFTRSPTPATSAQISLAITLSHGVHLQRRLGNAYGPLTKLHVLVGKKEVVFERE